MHDQGLALNYKAVGNAGERIVTHFNIHSAAGEP
jgi:hypothetical protein